jgi:tetratricopeptide (TPR) repeat protein
MVSTSDRFVRFAVLPITEGAFTVDGYTLFSVEHLVDFANLLPLLLPGLAVIVLSIGNSMTVRGSDGRIVRFLLLVLAVCLAVAFVFDPKLGMPRDWDLFAFGGVPLAVLAMVLLLGSPASTAVSGRIAVLVIGLGLLSLIPRAIAQAVPEISIKHIETYFELDVMKSRPGRFTLKEYYTSVGDDSLSEVVSTTWQQRFPGEAWFQEAITLSAQGQFEESATLFRQIINQNPVHHAAWTNLGACYVGMKKYDTAIAVLEIADGLNPYSAPTFHNMAHAWYGLGQLEQAEKYWLRSLGYDPDYLGTLVGLTTVYRRMGRTEEYRELLARVTSHPKASEGVVRLFRDAPDSALIDELAGVDLSDAGLSDLELATTYFQMGTQYELRRDLANAEKFWLKSLEQDTVLLDVLLALGDFYREQGRQAEYVQNFVRIGMRDDAPANFIQGLAELQLRQGNLAEAAETLKRWLATGKDSAYVERMKAQHPGLSEYF